MKLFSSLFSLLREHIWDLTEVKLQTKVLSRNAYVYIEVFQPSLSTMPPYLVTLFFGRFQQKKYPTNPYLTRRIDLRWSQNPRTTP